MSMSISRKYLKGEEDTLLESFYIISPPENMPELAGYVMKQRQEYCKLSESSITFFCGSEWNKKEKVFYYMFEREEKIPGHPSKRFRFSEEELIRAYGLANSPSFDDRLDRRIQKIARGPGSLVRIRFREQYDSGEDWCIAPDNDLQWVYTFNYDALRDTGKHNRKANGFAVLEQYHVDDIAVFRIAEKDNENSIYPLLKELSAARNLLIKSISIDSWTRDCPTQEIAQTIYSNTISSLIRSNGIRKGWGDFELKEKAGLINALSENIEEMGSLCENYMGKFKAEKIKEICERIKELSGIEIQ